MEHILLEYVFPKETIIALIILFNDTKVTVCSLDGDTDFFDIVAGDLQGDTQEPFLFIFSLEYVVQTLIDLMKKNFTLEKRARTKRYPTENISLTKYVAPSINFQTFLYRHLKLSYYVIAIHLMRWLTNFYDFRFKWTATAAIGIHPTKAWLSQLVNFKNAICTFEERHAIKFCFKLGKNAMRWKLDLLLWPRDQETEYPVEAC